MPTTNTDSLWHTLLAQAPALSGGKNATLQGAPSVPSAATDAAGGAGSSSTALPTPGGAGSQPNPFSMMLPIGLLLVFMIGMSWWSQGKEKKKRTALLGSLARNDRVQTAGGMIGTIVELKDDEVVLRVDESTNTKIAFSRSAVQTVLRKGRGNGAEAQPAGATA